MRPTFVFGGEGRGWVCSVNWETPQKRKSVQSLLLMIVGCGCVFFFIFIFIFFSNQLRVSYKRKYRSKTTSREYEPSWHLDTYESTFSMPQGIKSRCVSPFLRRNHNLTKPNFHLRRWRKAVIKLETRDEYKKIPWFLEHLRWCPKMGPTTNFVKSQCRPSAACYSLDIQNYPAEEQGNYWDKTKKDITILSDVTSLFVLFVLVSSKAIL